MSNSVEDIITELESEFDEQRSFKTSVKTSDGEIVHINQELWEESPVLREHSVSGTSHKVLAAPKSVLLALIRAYEDETFPSGIRDSYDLFDAASELQLQDLTSKCFDKLCATDALHESRDFPTELSVATIMRVVKVISDTPLRTADVYRGQLSRIARYCKNNRDVMSNAMSLLRQSLEKFKRIGLEGIPANFAAQSVPVAIYKHMGKLQTGVILGSGIRAVNLFGDRINGVDLAKIRCFHLKYGQYLLYCNHFGNVYDKNLQDDSAPTRVLSGCRHFITRKIFVFATHKVHGSTSILLRMNDEKFERIYQCSGDIQDIDFDETRRVLAVLEAGSKIRLFRLKHKNLFVLGDTEVPERSFRVFLLEKGVFVVRCVVEGQVESYRCPMMSIGEMRKSDRRHERKLDKESGDLRAWSSVTHCGGKYYQTDDGRLERLSYPWFTFKLDLKSTEKLMPPGELSALSELWMSP